MTGDSSSYPYTSPEAPEVKINYSYSKFRGEAFLADWKASRMKILECSPTVTASEMMESCGTSRLLTKWKAEFSEGIFKDHDRLDLLIKRFEVTRKIYANYNEEFRPSDKSSFRHPGLYVLFANLLCLAYQIEGRLQYLNALLKVNDINSGLKERLDPEHLALLKDCTSAESEFIDNLRHSLE